MRIMDTGRTSNRTKKAVDRTSVKKLKKKKSCKINLHYCLKEINTNS